MLIDSLRLENATKLHWTNKIALVDFPKGKIWQSVKIAARKNFPVKEINKYMKESLDDKTVLAVNSSTFSNVAQRIAQYVAALGRDSLIFSIRLGKGSRKVIIQSGSDASVFQETLTMLEPAKEDVTIDWPLEDVMPVLLYVKDDGILKIKVSKNGRSSLHSKTVSLIIAKKESK